MVIVCKKCGKKYKLSPDGLTGKRFVFKCKSCSDSIPIRLEGVTAPDSAPPADPAPGARRNGPSGAVARSAEPEPGTGNGYKAGLPASDWKLSLFLIAPILIVIASSVFYLIQARELAGLHIAQGSETAARMAEWLITEKARSVAGQCRAWLLAHPGLNETNFNTDAGLKSLAVVKVGRAGITFMYSVSTGQTPAKIWLNPEERMYGSDLNGILHLFDRAQAERVETLFQHANKGENKEVAGNYIMRDKQKKPREQYMVLTPVEGTKFGIAAAASLDEFTRPSRDVAARASELSAGMRNAVVAIIAGAFLLLILAVRPTLKIGRRDSDNAPGE